jgi:hypothetical protein
MIQAVTNENTGDEIHFFMLCSDERLFYNKSFEKRVMENKRAAQWPPEYEIGVI